MKKTKSFLVAAATALLTACGTMGQAGSGNSTSGNILGAVLTDVLQGGTLGNVITSVIGAQKVTAADLIGSWTYSQPGCAFTSQELLAQAGGEAMAQTIKDKLASTYQTVGVNSANTKITFNQDGTFTSTIAGKTFSGKYTFDEANYKISLQGLLLNINCYAKKNTNGIGLLFEASKLLTILQTMTALSGNSTAQTIGDLSKNYDGLRIGFDFKK